MHRETGEFGTSWNMDEALVNHAYSARLAYLLIQILPKSEPVVDYGCGPGMYVAFLRARGYRALGVEGTPQINEIGMVNDICVVDLSKPLPQDFTGPKWAGSSLSLEVGEHIDPTSETVFIDTLTKHCTGRLVLSWALPGQGGLGHVNEQSNQYIIAQLAQRGFAINAEASNFLRSNMAGDALWWFRDTLMVFDKKA